MKKSSIIFLIIGLVFTFTACSTLSDNTVYKLTIERNKVKGGGTNEEVIISGESVVFEVLDQLPPTLDESCFVWYVNGEKQESKGRTITLTTDKSVNLGYYVYAAIETGNFTAKSNTLRCIAVMDLAYEDYALAFYRYVDKVKETRGIEDIPGLSLSVYGHDGNISFDIYDGYAHLGNKIKNTAETKHILCSVSKPITAAVFFKLMSEEGSNLSLNQKVSDFLTEDDFDPEHKGNVLSKINMDATVGELIHHLSGIDEYLGVEFVLDLLSKEKKGFLFDLLSKVIMKREAQYPYENGWAPYMVFPYIVSDSDTSRGYRYASPNYIVLGMIEQKILDDRYPGMTIGEYVNQNFVLPYCDSPILLAPEDIDNPEDYVTLVAGQNIYDSEMAEFIQTYSPIDPSILKYLGINKEGKAVYNFEDVFSNINESFCKSCWTAGGYIANSNQIARVGYYLMSKDTEDEKNADVRAIMRTDVGTDRFVGLAYGIYDRTLTDENGENPVVFYGHNGKIIGESNSMMYDQENDFCVTILIDSNTPEDDFNSLLYDIHLAGLEK